MSIQVEPKWNDLINFSGLKQEHLTLLHANKDIFESYTSEIVMNFYIRVLKNDNLYKIVNQHSSFERLTNTQTMYFKSLFSNRMDNLYIMYLQKIAYVHYKIGLSSEWYLAGVNTYLDEIFNICKDLDNGFTLYHAFSKRILFDTQVCIAEYERLKENNRNEV